MGNGGVAVKRALRIISVLTLVSLGAAIIGQVLVFALGVSYSPSGQLVHPTPMALVASALAGFGGIASMPLTFVTFILGLVAAADERRYGWLVALVVAGGLAFAGLLGMAWVILSGNSPVAFQTPLVGIPLVTLLYGFFPARHRPAASGAR
jgi:hypothetical protein